MGAAGGIPWRSAIRIPFCPNPKCIHHAETPRLAWYVTRGCYHTKLRGTIRRYRCLACNKSFSSQTFHTSYYLKRPGYFKDIFFRHAEAQSGLAIARATGLSFSSVQNRIDRLSRQSLALHAALRPLASTRESVCIDGFLSFSRSQFFPTELTISITSASRFVLEISEATRRRSGNMTEEQKMRAAVLYPGSELETGAIGRAFRDLLDTLQLERPPSICNPLIIITDEKPQYRSEIFRHSLFRNQDGKQRVIHHTVSSRLPRTSRNPLFASNYLDRELRKDQANHHRETTCFTRNSANGMSRITCYMAWHNYWKRFLVKAPLKDGRVHADHAGIPPEQRRNRMKRFFSERMFLSHLKLTPPMERIWRKLTRTPGMDTPSYLPLFALS